MIRSFFALSIALAISAGVAAAPVQAKNLKSSSQSNASTAKKNAQSKAAAAGVDKTTVKANAQNLTQDQKNQAWFTVQSKVYQRIEAAAQKASAACKGNAQCQTKVAQAKTQFKAQAKAEAKKDAQATVQWCKETKCYTEAVAAKAQQIYYHMCAQYFNNC